MIKVDFSKVFFASSNFSHQGGISFICKKLQKFGKMKFKYSLYILIFKICKISKGINQKQLHFSITMQCTNRSLNPKEIINKNFIPVSVLAWEVYRASFELEQFEPTQAFDVCWASWQKMAGYIKSV